jgi:CheY-like chemotaxis protein
MFSVIVSATLHSSRLEGTSTLPEITERSGPTILIVDDDPDVRISLRQLLEFYGYHVVEAGNGVEALEVLARKPVSFMITDLYMPRMDGIELLREVRNGSSRPRTVAMSGVIHLEQAMSTAAASLLGADAVLDKPFTRQQLLRALATAVD